MRGAKAKTAVAAKTIGAHTPGPWSNGGRLGYAHLVQSKTKNIAAVYGSEVTAAGAEIPRSAEEAVSNTTLIVAAPDLLNACRAALEFVREELSVDIASNSIVKNGEPVPGTVDELAVPYIREKRELEMVIVAAIQKAEGRI